MGLTRWLTTDGPGTCMSSPPPAEEPKQQTFGEVRQQSVREKFVRGLEWEARRG
jgi:hypothetical protein